MQGPECMFKFPKKINLVCLVLFLCMASVMTSCNRSGSEDSPGADLVEKLENQGLFKDDGIRRIYVAFRDNGLKRSDYRVDGNNIKKSLESGINKTLKDLSSNNKGVNAIELCIAYDFKNIPTSDRDIMNWNVYRGIEGIEFNYRGGVMAFCPTEMLANNSGFVDVLRKFASRYGLSASVFGGKELGVSRFSAYQYLYYPGKMNEPGSGRLVKMFRGNTLVRQEDVTQENVEKLAEGMGNWLSSNIQIDGRLVYKYWPSKELESRSNNMIRQFLGTVSFGRWMKYKGDPEMKEKFKFNLEYNLNHFYKEDENKSVGYIEKYGKAKLGAAAVAALAIHESDTGNRFVHQENMLMRLTNYLWNESGKFISFYKPERDDNQNFYPGEALVYWSEVYSADRDDKLLRKFMKSFHYYKTWHLSHRNPAFIPWHTQAYYNIWLLTKNDELKDFIFDMNDWLISVMQKDDNNTYKDLDGRFYSQRPYYGPPHASSTGVYLEGLIDAYKLANTVGDSERQENYRIAILKGLRSVMQLQFSDDVDMFYISEKGRVAGGIRTTVYDNEIRVDNVQHNLMAVIKILMEFERKDYDIN